MTKIIIRDPTEQPKPGRLARATQTVLMALTLSLVAAFAAWLAYTAACVYSPRLGMCRLPGGAWLVMVATLAVTWAWIAWMQADKLQRRLRKGMYRRRVRSFGPGFGRNWERSFRNVKHFLWEGELPQTWAAGRQHPALYHNRAGWWVDVPMDGGKLVWVGQQAFYEWVVQVMAVKSDLKAGESPIGQRLWEPLIGRPQWHARCKLLEEVGAAICTTDTPYSRRLVRTDVIGIMEDLEESRPVEAN